MQINQQVNISFSPSVHSRGVILDQRLSFKEHVLSICRVAYLEFGRISAIHHYLSVDATTTLICAFVRVYCLPPPPKKKKKKIFVSSHLTNLCST